MARFKLYTIKADGGKKLKFASDNLEEAKKRFTSTNHFIIDTKKGEKDSDKKISQQKSTKESFSGSRRTRGGR